jgi:hypothetical protein
MHQPAARGTKGQMNVKENRNMVNVALWVRLEAESVWVRSYPPDADGQLWSKAS